MPTRLLCLVLLAAACSSSPKSAAWEEQVVYFVMTDRFANGDPTNDDQKRGEFDPKSGDKYSGGDLQGVIDKLDYIQGLGATAVWITPPVANMWWDPLQQSGGYHGYWARNLKKVDEHLGTLDTYQKLAAGLHKRNMLLIQDVVPNHMGNYFTYSSYDPADPTKGFVKNTAAVPGSKPEQAPFDQDDATDPAQKVAGIYHWTPVITDYSDSNQELNYQVSDLDDLNTENPVTRKALRDSYGYWIKNVGVDAFRIDTAKYVPHEFWHDFFFSTDPDAPGMHAVARSVGRDRLFAFGEVYEVSAPLDDQADKKVGSYHGTASAPELPAVLEYPLYEEIKRVFAGSKPTSYMTYRLGKLMDPSLYPNPYATPTFIDNHDNPRFLAAGTQTGMLQALAFLFTIPGIPIVYYGTEQTFTETRAAMFKGGYLSDTDHFATDSFFYRKIKTLSDLRKSSKVFTHGSLEVLYDDAAGAGPLAYRRTLGSETALVLFNTSEGSALVTGMKTGLPPGTVLEVLYSAQGPAAPVVGAGGLLTAVLPAKAILIARATPQVLPVLAPAASIAVITPIDGQTFTKDMIISGTVSPAATRLKLVLDSAVDKATEVTVAADGSWSAVLPVSSFPTGRQSHTLSFLAPDAGVATPAAHFDTEVVFTGQVIAVADPVGDDKGPKGTYTYPQDSTFRHQMDITNVKLEVGVTTLKVAITMADWSTVWKPPNGFDHTCFNIFFSVPGKAGVKVLPKLNASAPPGFAWSYNQFTFGWANAMYSADGATADTYGSSAIAPEVSTDLASKTVTFVYDRRNFGLASWSGTKIYLTTWDYDGIGANFRPLSPAGGQWQMGGGAATDPLIMDDVPPITIP